MNVSARKILFSSLPALLVAAGAFADSPGTASEAAKPDFEQLVVKIEPFGAEPLRQTEELRIEATGRCWYKVEGRAASDNVPARPASDNVPARPPAAFHHELASEHVRRINEGLKATHWLAAEGAEGLAPSTHPTTVRITVQRDGEERSVVCHGRRPEPYASLLHAIQAVAIQERRLYLKNYVSGEAGDQAWAEIGREIAHLRGDTDAEPPFPIDYERYLPTARRILPHFYSREDVELIPAVRLVGYYELESELPLLHRMAHDRSSRLRAEVAWALGRIHHETSLPVLAEMMSAPASREAAGPQLIQWGEAAIPHIVPLIHASTDADLASQENIAGEDMIRAYLERWDKLERPIDPRVPAAVRQALNSKDPANGLIRTEYHVEFLQRLED